MNANANLAGIPLTPDLLIEEYVRLRDQKKAAQDKIDAWINASYNARMKEIETSLMDTLNTNAIDSMKTEHGTAFKRTETSVTVADPAAFRSHVIGSEDWDLIDFRANKTAVKDFVENNDGLLPPGVNLTQAIVISVRKPS